MGEINCNAGLYKCQGGRLFLGFAKFGAWYWERVNPSDLVHFGVPAGAAESIEIGGTVGLSFSGVSVVPWVEIPIGSTEDQKFGLQSSFLLDGKPVLSQKTLARMKSKTFARRCVDALRAFVTGRW